MVEGEGTSGPQHTDHRHRGGLLLDADGPIPIVPRGGALQACWGLVLEQKGRSSPISHAKRGEWAGWGYTAGPQKAPGWKGSGTHWRYLGHNRSTTDKLGAPQGSDKGGSGEHGGTGMP